MILGQARFAHALLDGLWALLQSALAGLQLRGRRDGELWDPCRFERGDVNSRNEPGHGGEGVGFLGEKGRIRRWTGSGGSNVASGGEARGRVCGMQSAEGLRG